MAPKTGQKESHATGQSGPDEPVGSHLASAPEVGQLPAIAAELAAALGQIRLGALDVGNRARVERALAASKRLTRLVGHGADNAEELEAAAQPALPDLTGYRVLLAVEGDERQAEFGRALARMGARYEIAPDARSGRTLPQAGDVDMAIIDDDLAGGAGRELIADLRAESGAGDRLAVLALCTADSEVAQQALRQAGADLVLAGPGLDRLGEALAALVEETSGGAGEALQLDHDRFARLLNVAGPDGAPELLDRLHEDLRQVEYGLGHALAELNPAETRTQTHVLVALAGAVGADALQRMTEALNAAAHRDARDEMTALGCRVMRQLAHLVRFISAQREAGGTL